MRGKFSIPIRVYYEDTDAGAVVYHLNYLKFFERARSEWLRELGFPQKELVDSFDVALAVRSLEISYLAPAYFQELLDVSVTVKECKRASAILHQQIARNEVVLCDATIRVACVNVKLLAPCGFPEKLHELLSQSITCLNGAVE